ncbi:HlyD family efflux transporter periplasmic adaptor subunit [uncultured Abyssibacter sp.]|uniref:HlyD family secretion protein n=1 Tax=uncultured Abyssibacter sp. TaxID=2320202 RepID=UPI0032B28CF2
MNFLRKNKLIIVVLMLAVGAVGYFAWKNTQAAGYGDGFVSGNGRIEATEIDVAAKLGGRIVDVYVSDGEFVKAGQVLAQMQIDTLEAQKDEARARFEQAENAVRSAEALVAVRRSELAAYEAVVVQREAELDAARRRLRRTESLVSDGATSEQQLDDDRATVRRAEATLRAARAQVTAGEAAIKAAESEVVGARSAASAARATVARIEADLLDSQLKSPRDGRVQYQIAQPGEVVGAGGKVLNLVDLSDVYMTFFLPETIVGRVALGQEVRIVLDAAPRYPIPAKVTFVASTAQFTPKTVETQSERQKLMFRVKATIDRELLLRHMEMVKTGLPGVAWLKLDDGVDWPPELTLRQPE